jgi:hypothetical protein
MTMMEYQTATSSNVFLVLLHTRIVSSAERKSLGLELVCGLSRL